jgi:hypothetical protein
VNNKLTALGAGLFGSTRRLAVLLLHHNRLQV